MPVRDEDQGRVSMAIAAPAGSADERFDLGYSRGRNSRLGGRLGRCIRTDRFWLLGLTQVQMRRHWLIPPLPLPIDRTTAIFRSVLAVKKGAAQPPPIR